MACKLQCGADQSRILGSWTVKLGFLKSLHPKEEKTSTTFFDERSTLKSYSVIFTLVLIPEKPCRGNAKDLSISPIKKAFLESRPK